MVHEVTISVGRDQVIRADVAGEPRLGIVVFVHGSGSSRHSPRNRQVAERVQQAGLQTVLVDLLTEDEERRDLQTREHRFDIDLLTDRVLAAVDWLATGGAHGPIGLFGASTGAAAALRAAAAQPGEIEAVVSRGGRPDLAGKALEKVEAPTLLIVGGNDPQVLQLNQEALAELDGESSLEVVPGAGHLFEEPGKLDQVADLAAAWFRLHLGASS
jgi:dienelactone hydrolase